ncbi:cholesterol 7-desaturase nvd 1-like [Microplitis mediator]|uniref:cholesterol 7-desaturase nvd 1-like n=1 Tax=Microplitis mediator TaxID=375433 RepID=UPI002553A9AC|nr:cholesterol 7-desaturase nvd 1-like [Microplitis mediator]
MIEWLIYVLIGCFVYILFIYKINYVQDLKNINERRKYLKNRKIGDLPPVYPNGWFALLESAQLTKGQVKHVCALGENFAVFRTQKGNVHIVDAYCPHLGANLAEGGKVIDDCIECPFHSWKFNGDGKCTSIPYSKTDPSKMETKSWKSCEVNKIIFVWYHAELADPEWELEPVKEITDESWRFQGRNEFYVNCHIQEIPENGADWAHLSAVHGPAKIVQMIPSNIVRHSWTGSGWRSYQSSKCTDVLNNDNDNQQTVNVKLHINNNDNNNNNSSNSKKHRATINLCHNLIFFNKWSIINLNINVEQIGPGYVELFVDTTFGPMYVIQTVTPLEPLLQRVTHYIYSPLLLSPYAKIVFLGECFMFERDIAVWNNKKYQKNPKLVREDQTISSYRKWYSNFYTDNSPTYQSVQSLDW